MFYFRGGFYGDLRSISRLSWVNLSISSCSFFRSCREAASCCSQALRLSRDFLCRLCSCRAFFALPMWMLSGFFFMNPCIGLISLFCNRLSRALLKGDIFGFFKFFCGKIVAQPVESKNRQRTVVLFIRRCLFFCRSGNYFRVVASNAPSF